MPAFFGNCAVNQTGPSMNGTETPGVLPVVYVNLTDTTNNPPQFSNQWFYAMAGSQSQVLAVALAAITTGKHVSAILTAPAAPVPSGPYPQLQALYLNTT